MIRWDGVEPSLRASKARVQPPTLPPVRAVHGLEYPSLGALRGLPAEAPAGVEPAFTGLQPATLPLGQGAWIGSRSPLSRQSGLPESSRFLLFGRQRCDHLHQTRTTLLVTQAMAVGADHIALRYLFLDAPKRVARGHRRDGLDLLAADMVKIHADRGKCSITVHARRGFHSVNIGLVLGPELISDYSRSGDETLSILLVPLLTIALLRFCSWCQAREAGFEPANGRLTAACVAASPLPKVPVCRASRLDRCTTGKYDVRDSNPRSAA